jgi:hypothetical protein
MEVYVLKLLKPKDLVMMEVYIACHHILGGDEKNIASSSTSKFKPKSHMWTN